MKIILLLVYLWRGQITIDQRPFATETDCAIAGGQRMTELAKDPRFNGGLFAGCVAVPMQQAENK